VNADASVFFALWLQKPLRIAAANPSGARLADAGARCVDLARPGPILELGAGTGSLTQGLVRAGCLPGRIIALEREPAGHRRRCDANQGISRRQYRAACRCRLQPADQMVSGSSAIRRRQTLPRSARTGRPLPAADERIFFAPAGPPPGNRRPGGLSRLAKPAAGADLGLFGTPPAY